MPKKQWVYSPKKPSKAQVPDAIKQEVMTKANALVEAVLKPKNVKPPSENPQNKGEILEIPITAASCDVLRNFALRDGFCRTRHAASREECTRQ